MRVFLTGGTGLIGSHVAERLRARGDTVVAMVRDSSDRRHLERLGCELVEGALLDPADRIASLMRGCDAVVHAAAMVFHRGTRKAFLRINVQGTRGILDAASRAAPRVVHLSSVAVYSGLSMDRPLTEERWTEADPERQRAYAASKHLSEAVAWEFHQDGAIRLTTVRPAVVYGERDRAATPIIVRAASLPVTPLPAGGHTALPLVYAGNVAQGITAALDRKAAVGRAFNLGLDHPITGRELIELTAAALGRSARTVPLPATPLRTAATAADWVRRAVPGLGPGGMARAVRSMIRHNPYDSGRARLELGWTNLASHREGVRRTVEWWSGRGAE